LARTGERIDRKALKEDALLNFVEQAGDHVRANLNLTLGVIAGVVVVALLAMLWRQDVRQKASAADESLSQVVVGYANGQYEQVVELSNSLQTSSPGSKSAVLSKYLAGASQMRLGRFPEAEQSLRAYLAESSKYPFYETAAQTALAASLEAQGKNADAAVIYQEQAAKLAEPLASEMQLSAARALGRAGQVDQAKNILEKLAGDNTGANAREARIELAILQSAR
jgi:tetratricopeptide (TPR) repeat protein